MVTLIGNIKALDLWQRHQNKGTSEEATTDQQRLPASNKGTENVLKYTTEN